MSQIEECVDAFGKPLEDLIASGKDPVFIISALGEIALRVAKSDPEHGATALRALITVLDPFV
ncbi:hypothetical protein CBA19CS22_39590 [Caballeronia novacaledonica]|uniref:Uncharacterized protein n=1 Tax=Caballeronia novacaledonica TaxID=1544861 RepID=A0ACB5R6F2_9BURK|nr:hypothetical protein CBA19CS22_39590 [Caballeronia novacaledonica]